MASVVTVSRFILTRVHSSLHCGSLFSSTFTCRFVYHPQLNLFVLAISTYLYSYTLLFHWSEVCIFFARYITILTIGSMTLSGVAYVHQPLDYHLCKIHCMSFFFSSPEPVSQLLSEAVICFVHCLHHHLLLQLHCNHWKCSNIASAVAYYIYTLCKHFPMYSYPCTIYNNYILLYCLTEALCIHYAHKGLSQLQLAVLLFKDNEFLCIVH